MPYVVIRQTYPLRTTQKAGEDIKIEKHHKADKGTRTWEDHREKGNAFWRAQHSALHVSQSLCEAVWTKRLPVAGAETENQIQRGKRVR